MDFSFSEEADAAGDLARQILEGQVTQDRLKELEQGRAPYDERTWAELAKAGLLGLALPEEVGGAGLGFIELYRVLEQVGRTVAPVRVRHPRRARAQRVGALPQRRRRVASLRTRAALGVDRRGRSRLARGLCASGRGATLAAGVESVGAVEMGLHVSGSAAGQVFR